MKVRLGVSTDGLYSDSQGLYREMQARRRNSEIIALRTEAYKKVCANKEAGGEMLVFLNEGYEWSVDIDLEKFFDNAPQDKLMSLVHNIVDDGDTELLIRKYLKAGVMIQGRYERTI